MLFAQLQDKLKMKDINGMETVPNPKVTDKKFKTQKFAQTIPEAQIF